MNTIPPNDFSFYEMLNDAEPNADGSTTVYFAPKQPDGVKRGNWIQTMPGKGWFVLLRLYSPLEPFFTKQSRPSEVELVR